MDLDFKIFFKIKITFAYLMQSIIVFNCHMLKITILRYAKCVNFNKLYLFYVSELNVACPWLSDISTWTIYQESLIESFWKTAVSKKAYGGPIF